VDDRWLDEIARTVHLGVLNGAVDPEAAFDLATCILEVSPLDPSAAQLAELSAAGCDQPTLIEAAMLVLDSCGFTGWLDTLQEAMRIVNRDVAATGLPGPCRLEAPPWSRDDLYVLTWDDCTDCDQGISPGCGSDALAALTAVADDAQGAIMESSWQAWPVCPQHALGTHAEVHDGAAVWWCKADGGHVAAAIGDWSC
jgi:hypothetical protein